MLCTDLSTSTLSALVVASCNPRDTDRSTRVMFPDSLVSSAPELGVQTFITSLASVNTYTARLYTLLLSFTRTVTQDVKASVTLYRHHHA